MGGKEKEGGCGSLVVRKCKIMQKKRVRMEVGVLCRKVKQTKKQINYTLLAPVEKQHCGASSASFICVVLRDGDCFWELLNGPF